MTRIAIIGGGISGLSAAFDLEQRRVKRRAMLGQVRSGRVQRNFAPIQCRGNGVVRETQQKRALGSGELLRQKCLMG